MLVNDVEIPAGVAGTNMTGTGWYNIPTLGKRSGGIQLRFPGWQRATGGRSVWQHGVSFRSGAESDQQRNEPAQGSGAGAGSEAAGIWSGWELQRRAVFEQPGVDPAGHPAACGLEPGGNRRGELRVGGGILRRTDRRAGPLRECDSVGAIPMQPGFAEAQECRRPGARNSQLGEAAVDLRSERRAATAGGELDGAGDAGEARVVQQHGTAGGRMAELRIRRRQQRILGHLCGSPRASRVSASIRAAWRTRQTGSRWSFKIR